MTVLAETGSQAVVCRWHETAGQVPDWPAAATPHAERAWMEAWQWVHTDPVREARFLQLVADGDCRVASFYLIAGNPEWSAVESEADMDPIWPGTVVYGPSPYAEYGGFGITSPKMIRTMVAQGLTYGRETGACAVVFPGLHANQASCWLEASPDGIAVRTTGAHQAPARGSVEAFQAAIPSTRARREFGRQWRRGQDAGLRLEVLHGTEMESSLRPFTELAVSTATRNESPGMYGIDIFRAGMQVPGAVLLAARYHDRLAGAFFGFTHGTTLYLWTAGLDYAALSQMHTYGWLLAESVRYAASRDIETIDIGRGNYHYKRRLGFTMIPLYAAVYLTRPDQELTANLAEMSRRIVIDSTRGADDAHVGPLACGTATTAELATASGARAG